MGVTALLLSILAVAPAFAVQQVDAPHVDAPASGGVRNVVVITLDTTRSDHLGCYGYFRDTTPNLDALAAESIRFTNCYSPIAHTTPSHASLFTGVYPFEHGVLTNSFQETKEQQTILALKTGPTLSTFAQAMQRKGLKTGGFVSATPVKRVTGIAIGFDAWSEPRGARRACAATTAEALRWLDSLDGAPFFLWVHLFDTHGPILPPTYPPEAYLHRYKEDAAQDRWLEERHSIERAQGHRDLSPAEANNIYDGQLRFLDDQFAELRRRLDTPALRDSTLIVVVGDHGHGLGQHHFMSHGTAYAEQLHVPLFLRAPGHAPRVVERPLSTIDVLPTALALAPALCDEAFLAQCRGGDALAAEFTERPLFGMSPPQRGLVTLFTTEWKLILDGRDHAELYSLASDSFELDDVAAKHPEMVKKMARLLRHELDEQRKRQRLHHPEGGPDGGVVAPVPPEILRQLESLGYADGDGDRDH